MSSFISNLDRLSEEIKATVLIVNHAGKDPSRGARGSSAFRAALDHEIRVTKPETGITNLTCEKAKDAEPFPPMSFRLKQSDVVDELGRMLAEPDGRPLRSCVLEEIEYVQHSSKANVAQSAPMIILNEDHPVLYPSSKTHTNQPSCVKTQLDLASCSYPG